MNYEEAQKAIENSDLKLNDSTYTIPTDNSQHPPGSFVFTAFKLIDITVAPKNDLGLIQAAKTRLSEKEALKSFNLLDSNDLEVMLTFMGEGQALKVMTLREYQDFLKDSKR